MTRNLIQLNWSSKLSFQVWKYGSSNCFWYSLSISLYWKMNSQWNFFNKRIEKLLHCFSLLWPDWLCVVCNIEKNRMKRSSEVKNNSCNAKKFLEQIKNFQNLWSEIDYAKLDSAKKLDIWFCVIFDRYCQ